MTSSNLQKTSIDLLQNACLVAWTSPFTKIAYILTLPPTPLERYFRAIWNAVSQAAVLILPQIKLTSQLLGCAYVSSWQTYIFKKLNSSTTVPYFPVSMHCQFGSLQLLSLPLSVCSTNDNGSLNHLRKKAILSLSCSDFMSKSFARWHGKQKNQKDGSVWSAW